MFKKGKKIIGGVIATLFFCTLVYSVHSVSAQDVIKYTHDSNNTYICFDKSTGIYDHPVYGSSSSCSGLGKDSIKLINGSYVYCAEWGKHINNMNYVIDSTWSERSKAAITSGLIIKEGESSFSDSNRRYTAIAASINTYFSRFLSNGKSSMDFYGTPSYRAIVDNAMATYRTINLSNKLPSVSINVSSPVMNEVNGYYVTNAINLSGIVSTYGGKGTGIVETAPVYTISVNNGASICTDALGTKNCTSSTNNTGTFYVKTATANSNVTITVSGSNSTTYSTSKRYKNAVDWQNQDLIGPSSFTINRSVKNTFVVSSPEERTEQVNHKISVYKADDNGSGLSGATLKLYKDDVSNSSNLLKSGSEWPFTYVSPTVDVENDDFFKHNYYIVESNAPDGYVLNTSPKLIYDKNSTKKTSSCYNLETGQEVDDKEYCNGSNYKYMCKPSDGGNAIDLSENQNCNFSSADEEAGEEVVTYEKICYNSVKNNVADEKYCNNKDKYALVIYFTDSIHMFLSNSKNIVRISKMDEDGKSYVEGASLKICSEASYNSSKNSCEAAKTIDDVVMSFVSDSKPYEFRGLKSGTYYIVEEKAPRGYIVGNSVSKFSIDKYGAVTYGNTKITNDQFRKDESLAVVVKNEKTAMTISKQDIATSKELPGATISICKTYVDEAGNIQPMINQYTNECIAEVLSDGTEATWVSSEEAKMISGLPVGTYALVEKIAPKGYSTAETVIFKMNDDGSLTDKDGNSLKDNKLVMLDAPIGDVKTGSLPVYVITGVLVLVVALGLGSYYSLNKKKEMTSGVKTDTDKKSDKIKNRKIHK